MFTLTNLWVLLTLFVFALLTGILFILRRKLGFTARVGLALVLGIAFGVSARNYANLFRNEAILTLFNTLAPVKGD